jgi:hypothetical protein
MTTQRKGESIGEHFWSRLHATILGSDTRRLSNPPLRFQSTFDSSGHVIAQFLRSLQCSLDSESLTPRSDARSVLGAVGCCSTFIAVRWVILMALLTPPYAVRQRSLSARSGGSPQHPVWRTAQGLLRSRRCRAHLIESRIFQRGH